MHNCGNCHAWTPEGEQPRGNSEVAICKGAHSENLNKHTHITDGCGQWKPIELQLRSVSNSQPETKH